MAKRGGLSISVKMILTTTLLIVITVLGSGLLDVNNIRRAFDDSFEQQTKLFREGRERLGEFGTPLFARAVQALLYDSGRDAEIRDLTRTTVAQDSREGDAGLAFAYIADKHAGEVAHCLETTKVDCALGNHAPITGSYPLIARTWAKAQEAWKADPGKLVRFDFEQETARYRVFAMPVSDPALPEPLLGYVVLGYDLTPIDAFASQASADKAAASRRSVLYTGLVGALFTLIGTVLAIVQGLSMSRPIKQLAWKADQIARGDLAARVDVSSGDEIGLLGENFNFMADQIAILLAQTAEKARLEQELEVAKAIQETLVPTPELVQRGPLSFAGYYQPAAQTGGDWWTWAELADGKVLLVVGDVTGHGVPSAMITAAAKAACDVARHVDGDRVTVTRLLELMNYAIIESAQRRFVMTCFASIIDTHARSITYANAGHNFPYVFRGGELTSLMIRGNRLGDERTSEYEARTTELAAGDVLVWYTDGIVECDNAAGEEFGEKRFRASVRRAAALQPDELRDAIIADATAHYGDAPRKDDITLVVGRMS